VTDVFADWTAPPALNARLAAGRERRRTTSRRTLAALTTTDRDPLGILAAQTATRVQELIPLRDERMAASPFAFYRGTAAIMAADLARDSHSQILVASCGDAHVANFGFYASPQRTLMFDLNDFDEAGWAPWEWDLKRLVTSIVIAGQATSRDETVVRAAALAAVQTYARSLAAGVRRSALVRYFTHFDAVTGIRNMDRESRRALKAAIRDAEKRTGDRAARKLTEVGANGRLTFVERPPTMTHVDQTVTARVHEHIADYVATANVDVRVVLQQYVVADLARRVVGVGSVGTRCYVVVFQDGEGNALLLQAKEAGRSVLEQFGGIEQPAALTTHVEQYGQGARVVALQRILQAVSDPFLGHLRNMLAEREIDFYVRQFHDMKGGVDMETLDDGPFHRYAQVCAATLARAHSQSGTAATVAGYIGNGKVVGDAILEYAFAYAALSLADYTAFVAARA